MSPEKSIVNRSSNARICGQYGIPDSVLRNKPIRQPGEALAELPTYTIPEAATFLAIEYSRLHSWYSGSSPILIASGHVHGFPLLSFLDLKEAYKVYLLRSKHSKSLQYLRKAMTDARQKTSSQHPLLDHEIDVMERLALIIPGRGRRPRRAVTLGDPTKPDYFPEVVKSWGVRISVRRDEILPWRFAASDDESTPVSLNPEVMSGRLVITGTRIPVNIIWGRRLSGEKVESIASDYRLDAHRVEQALMHIDKAIYKKVA